MSKPAIIISISTHADTAAEAFGRSFIETLCEEDARLAPEKLSRTENYRDTFAGIDDFLENWWATKQEVRVDGRLVRDAVQGPSWKRKSTLANRGSVSHGFTNQRNKSIPGRIWFECRWASDVHFDRLFAAWVELAQAEIAMLHVFSETERSMPQTEASSWFQTGSFGGPAKPGLPNMGWAMAYGGSYAAEVDLDRIKSAGFPIKTVDGAIIVQVTDKLSDVVDDFAHFSRRRAELRSIFRSDLFWMRGEPTIQNSEPG